MQTLKLEKRMNTLEFLSNVHRLDAEYRKAKALDENADLKYPLSQAECKVARAISDAQEQGFEDLVLVEDFNTIWEREIAEFSAKLRELGCKKILWANNSSGLIDTLKELSENGWVFSGFAEVKGNNVLVLVSE